MLTPQGWWESPIAGKVRFQSKYEKLWCEFADNNNLNWSKNKERFEYTSPFDGKQHKYIPDFIVEDDKGNKLYIEIKGMVRKADPAKFEAFPEDKRLVLLGYPELKQLGLPVVDPLEAYKGREVKPDQWPYKLLQNMPDFLEKGELTEEVKQKVSAEVFLEHLDNFKRT